MESFPDEYGKFIEPGDIFFSSVPLLKKILGGFDSESIVACNRDGRNTLIKEFLPNGGGMKPKPSFFLTDNRD